MSQIQVTDLTYGYEGSFDMIFENVSFGIDTDYYMQDPWRIWRGNLKIVMKWRHHTRRF